MYEITREETRKKLKISTRTVDRYIRNWKLRSKKIWKIVYINTDDINNLLWWKNIKQEVIMPNQKESKETKIIKNEKNEIDFIYNDLKQELLKKEEKIIELTKINWQLEEIVKNSIPIIEFKKTQFLLEEWKETLKNEVISKEKEIEKINKKLNETIKLNIILVWVSIVFFIILIIMFFIKL